MTRRRARKYAYAESSDEGYQRLRRTIDLTGATTGALKFKVSYDTERDYDYVFVEAHTVGQDDWTTLPDKNGHTTDERRRVVRHRLGHGPPVPRPLPDQPDLGDADCTNTGTTGEWNGATGNSGGFQDWEIDLTRLQGQAGRGLDHLRAGLRGLRPRRVPRRLQVRQGRRGDRVQRLRDRPRPVGRRPAARRAPRTHAAWVSRGAVGFTEGPGIATEDTLLWGFGLEGITTRARARRRRSRTR